MLHELAKSMQSDAVKKHGSNQPSRFKRIEIRSVQSRKLINLSRTIQNYVSSLSLRSVGGLCSLASGRVAEHHGLHVEIITDLSSVSFALDGRMALMYRQNLQIVA